MHITGHLDHIDGRTLLPVIVVEDLTLQIADPVLAELANQARLKNAQDFLETYLTHSPAG